MGGSGKFLRVKNVSKVRNFEIRVSGRRVYQHLNLRVLCLGPLKVTVPAGE